MLNINISTPSSVMNALKIKYKDLRLSLNYTQAYLAKKSGVSLGSIKRFESSGKISLESLLNLSFTLECLDDFTKIANSKDIQINSIDDLLENETVARKRGSKKWA